MKDAKRLQMLLSNCIDYICELKKHEPAEDTIDFFENIIGLNKAEMQYYLFDIIHEPA